MKPINPITPVNTPRINPLMLKAKQGSLRKKPMAPNIIAIIPIGECVKTKINGFKGVMYINQIVEIPIIPKINEAIENPECFFTSAIYVSLRLRWGN